MTKRKFYFRCNEGHEGTTFGHFPSNSGQLAQIGLRAGKDHDRRYRKCNATTLCVGPHIRDVRNKTAGSTAQFKRTTPIGGVSVQTIQPHHDGTNNHIVDNLQPKDVE